MNVSTLSIYIYALTADGIACQSKLHKKTFEFNWNKTENCTLLSFQVLCSAIRTDFSNMNWFSFGQLEKSIFHKKSKIMIGTCSIDLSQAHSRLQKNSLVWKKSEKKFVLQRSTSKQEKKKTNAVYFARLRCFFILHFIWTIKTYRKQISFLVIMWNIIVDFHQNWKQTLKSRVYCVAHRIRVQKFMCSYKFWIMFELCRRCRFDWVCLRCGKKISH